MDAATLQSRIFKGYGKAAVRLGVLCDLYRPIGAVDPIAPATKLQSILASFNAQDWKYIRPNKYGNPTWYGLFDATPTMQGDYLIGSQGTFFIAGQQLHLSILMVECNRTLALMRAPAKTNATGAQPYGGLCVAEDVATLGAINASGAVTTGWPASVLLGGRADSASNLPLSVKNAGWQILLPASVPVPIHAGDVLLDDLGRRYLTEACELTDAGWRINAKEAHT